MYADDPARVKAKYKLGQLRDIENYVADLVDVQVPFNNCITGYSAFSHKAGIHVKALLNNPATYEILKPEDFGMTRYIHVAHRLTGWNAIKSRAEQLKLSLSDAQIKDATERIKALADLRHKFTVSDVDSVLHEYELKNKSERPCGDEPAATKKVKISEETEENATTNAASS